MSAARVAILQFPGVNCEAETLRAVTRAGLEGEIFRWTQSASALRGYQAFVLPGGFAYQDRVRAGALAAKDTMLDVLAAEAELGKPVIGICNGAQILVESGLVPAGTGVDLALTENRMPGRSGYHARWIYTRIESSPCLFTRHMRAGSVLPLPVAHGEGRFVSREKGRFASLKRNGQVPLVYATARGGVARRFPDNPNGSEAAAAAVCNAQGNVLAVMPHPERAVDLGAMPPTVVGEWAGRREAARSAPSAAGQAGPGMALFEGLRLHFEASS